MKVARLKVVIVTGILISLALMAGAWWDGNGDDFYKDIVPRPRQIGQHQEITEVVDQPSWV
jgi:hypothetical protein